MEVGDHTFPAGTWEVVPVEDITSLELSAVLYATGEADPALLVGVRATVRDAEGHLLDGAPVRWEVQGDPVAPSPLSGDLYTLLDQCVPREERVAGRSSTLVARVGELSDQVTVDWDGSIWEETDPDAPYQPHEDCPQAGCGCASPGSAWAVAWAPLLLGVLRRRRSCTRLQSDAGVDVP